MLTECLLVSLVYGITPIMYKHSIGVISIESFIIIFGLFYFSITLVFMYMFRHKLIKDVDILSKHNYIYGIIMLSALLIFIVGNYVFLTVLENNKSYIVTSIIASYPLVSVFFGYLIFNDQVKVEHFAGILMVVLGIILISRKT